MNEDIEKIAVSNLGYNGRMISGSKSGYSRAHKKNLAVFNANVCTENGKIWYGDLDVTIDHLSLRATSLASGMDIYVLFEMDGRFENEDSPRLDKALIVFHPDGSHTIGEAYKEYVSSFNLDFE